MGERTSIHNIERSLRLPGNKPNGKSRSVTVKPVRYNTSDK